MRRIRSGVPTALSSMMPWALVFAADMAAGFAEEAKKRRRKEMVGDFEIDAREYPVDE